MTHRDPKPDNVIPVYDYSADDPIVARAMARFHLLLARQDARDRAAVVPVR